jgi:3-O-methylgallate 3,4-dioxygenase
LAKIVLGFGTSHGPTINTKPEGWADLGEKDQRDPRFSFEEALKRAPKDIADQITMEKKTERWNALQADVKKIEAMVSEAKPDVAIVVSNPHGILPDDTMSVFGVYRGETMSEATAKPSERRAEMARFSGGGVLQARPERAERQPRTYPGYRPLADHLIDQLIQSDFDVSTQFEYRPELGVDGSFTYFYPHYQKDQSVPIVPLIVSRYLPSQATPGRCIALGRALREAIESWDSNQRVAIYASGGLSHQIIDEELDHRVIDGLQERDWDNLSTLPRDRLNGAPGTPEILNWLVAAGAMDPAPMTLIDYQPCYRSMAGTGHGVTFGVWE